MAAACPVCGEVTSELSINNHLDKGCPTSKQQPQQQQQWSFLTGKTRSPKSSQDTKEAKTASDKPRPISTESKQPNEMKDTVESSDTDKKVARTENVDGGAGSPPSKRQRQMDSLAPLAEQMRPSNIEDYVGQAHLIGPNGVLRQLLTSEQQKLPSMVFWGPSGVGKTTLARVLASQLKARFVELSAPSTGTNDVKRIISESRREWQLMKRRTVLFLDEIHRFSRSQQDSLLSGVERGDVTLIGATTENPSFKLSGALLSRMRVFVLQPLSKDELRVVVERAAPNLPSDTLDIVVNAASATGDARQALNMLETVRELPEGSDPKLVLKHTMVYDQRGEYHYDLISAFHKSVRGGDADAALYYLSRMLVGGEDPLYVSRRLMRIASEDIGLADDSCLPFAVAVHTSVQQVGMPEADVMLAHAAVKFARASKSVEVYQAQKAIVAEIKQDPNVSGAPVPLHLRNAPTKLMGDLGYGAEYKYNPDFKGKVFQEYLPREIKGRKWLGMWQPSQEDTPPTN